MHETQKLHEAMHFFDRMTQTMDKQQEFVWNLSAFLTAARSVLQFGVKEAAAKAGGQAWFDQYVSARPALRFFKEKRDLNVHTKPIQPRRHITVVITETLRVSDSVRVTVTDRQGNVVEHAVPEEKPAPPPVPTTTEVTEVFVFDDWAGPEDVVTLSKTYLGDLSAFVTEGRAKGFLTV